MTALLAEASVLAKATSIGARVSGSDQ